MSQAWSDDGYVGECMWGPATVPSQSQQLQVLAQVLAPYEAAAGPDVLRMASAVGTRF